MNVVPGLEYHYGVLKGYLTGQNAPADILVAIDALYAAASQSPLRADALEAIRLVTEAAEKLIERVESVPAPVERVVLIKPATVPPESISVDACPTIVTAVVAEADPQEKPVTDREEMSDQAKIDAFLETRTSLPANKSTKQKKRQEWSPEARAAAGERMRAMRAAGLIKGRDGTAGISRASKEPLTQVIVRQPNPPSPVIEPSDDNLNDQIDDSNRATITASPITSPADRWSPAPLTAEDWPDIQQMLATGKSRARIAGDYDMPLSELDAFIERNLEEAKERRAAKEMSSGEA